MQRIEQEQMKFTDENPITILRRTDPIVEQIDASLRSGEEVNLSSRIGYRKLFYKR